MYKTIDEVPREDIWELYLEGDPNGESQNEVWKDECISEMIEAFKNPQMAHEHVGGWGAFYDLEESETERCNWALEKLDQLGVDGFRYQDMVESVGVIDLKKLLLLGVRHVDLYEVLTGIRY